MIRLVVNADDLGLNAEIDRGIFRAHRDGIVTSATVLVRGREAPKAVQQAKNQGLALGLHLCLTTRLPPAAPRETVRSLVPDGLFRSSWLTFLQAYSLGRIRLEEVYREFRAQVRLARTLGAEPDHIDGHQHLHVLPGIRSIVTELSQAEGLPVRWPIESPRLDWFQEPLDTLRTCVISGLGILQKRPARSLSAIGVFGSGKLTEDRLVKQIDRLSEGDHELIAHPGEMPGVVPEDPAWRYEWSSELEALCARRVHDVIRTRKVELTTYKNIFGTVSVT